MKLVDQETVIVYRAVKDSLSGKVEMKFETQNIIDDVGFAEVYSKQEKRDEFYININEQMIIVVGQFVYVYKYKSRRIELINRTEEDHKGGSLVYLPHNNSLYCPTGLNTIFTEKIQLDEEFQIPIDSYWEKINQLTSPRGYYCYFVQNDCKIYLLLGFDLWDNNFLTSIEKMDVTIDEQWKSIKLRTGCIPRLTFAACIAISDDELLITGGKDRKNQTNNTIYAMDLREYSFEDSKVKTVTGNGDGTKEEVDDHSLFYQETSFIPLSYYSDEGGGAFFMSIFDSKDRIHLLNLRYMEYSCISNQIDDPDISEVI